MRLLFLEYWKQRKEEKRKIIDISLKLFMTDAAIKIMYVTQGLIASQFVKTEEEKKQKIKALQNNIINTTQAIIKIWGSDNILNNK